jgi:hypothetical protein
MIVAAETPLPARRQSATADAIAVVRPVPAKCRLPQVPVHAEPHGPVAPIPGQDRGKF